MKGPSRPNMFEGGGEPFVMAALLLERYETLELNHNSGYVSRVTPPHKHNDTGACANAVLLTYLLNGEILLFIRT